MIIDGKTIAATHSELLKEKVKNLAKKPKLVAIIVGQDPGSLMYLRMKAKRAQEVGIVSEIVAFGENASSEEIIRKINEVNSDSSVNGVLVQLPLPMGLKSETEKILQSIDPEKDVDGLTGKGRFLPATVRGILSMLDTANLFDKKVTVIGQGRLVGKPLADFIEQRSARVNRCDEFTDKKTLINLCKQADILVSATGVSHLVTTDMVKKGAVVIDCGAPEAEVDFENVSQKALAITPVPGGVGPMTVVSLLENVVEAAIIQQVELRSSPR